MAQIKKQRRRGPKGFPTPAEERVKAIHRLSKEIAKLTRHFKNKLSQFRDGQAKKALERKIQRRNTILEALLEQDPQVHQKLITELQEGGLL